MAKRKHIHTASIFVDKMMYDLMLAGPECVASQVRRTIEQAPADFEDLTITVRISRLPPHAPIPVAEG